MSWNPDIEIIEGDIHRDFLREAYILGHTRSEDPITQTGAVIVDPALETAIARGWNHFPAGLEPTLEQMSDSKWKYEHIIHAEPHSVYEAARAGRVTQGAIMYMPWVPCTPCALAIIGGGIKTLIGHKELIMKTPERWWESTDQAIGLLTKCGVKHYMYEGKIGGVEHMFNREIWTP